MWTHDRLQQEPILLPVMLRIQHQLRGRHCECRQMDADQRRDKARTSKNGSCDPQT